MIVRIGGAGYPPGHHEVLFAQAQQLATYHARQIGPADEGHDDGDAEVDPDGRPVHRQRGRQGHPQRQHRNGADELDEALHHDVGGAAEIPGRAADADPQHKAQYYSDQADGQRDPGAEHHAAEHVAAETVGPEQVGGASLRAEQVQVAVEQAPQLVVRAAHEQAQRIPLRPVHGIDATPGSIVHPRRVSIHEGAQMQAVVTDKTHALRRGRQHVGKLLHVVGGDELAEPGCEIHDQQNGTADQGQPVLLEAPPHQLIVGCQIEPFPAGLRVAPSGTGAAPLLRHYRSILMRGSMAASRMSEMNVPTTVRMERIRMNAPARNMSWLSSEFSSSGPVVGRLSTTATMGAPETMVVSCQPMVLTSGFSAIRTGYL